MKIYEQKDDEAFVLSGDFDIAIPFSFALYSDSAELQIKVFPSLRPQAEEFAAKFGGVFAGTTANMGGDLLQGCFAVALFALGVMVAVQGIRKLRENQ